VGEVRITTARSVFVDTLCAHQAAATGHNADLPRRCPWSSVCVLETTGRTHKRQPPAFKWWRWHNAQPQQRTKVKIFSLLLRIGCKLDAVWAPECVIFYERGKWLRQSSEWINWFILHVCLNLFVKFLYKVKSIEIIVKQYSSELWASKISHILLNLVKLYQLIRIGLLAKNAIQFIWWIKKNNAQKATKLQNG